MNINEMSKAAHDNSVSKGFYDGAFNFAEKIALIHSELSEALEGNRKGVHCTANIQGVIGWVDDKDFTEHFEKLVKDTPEDELADAIIRIGDLAGFLKINLELHIQAKMRYNALRPHKHGKKY